MFLDLCQCVMWDIVGDGFQLFLGTTYPPPSFSCTILNFNISFILRVGLLVSLASKATERYPEIAKIRIKIKIL